MKRQQIVAALIVATVLGGIFLAYQYYFREQIQKYKEDEQLLAEMEKRLEELTKTFGSKGKPEDVIEQYKNVAQPWADAVESRAKYFNIDRFTQVNPLPEGAVMLKQFYAEEANKMVQSLYYDAQTRNVSISGFDPYFGQPNPGQLVGAGLSQAECENWLRQISFGTNFMKMLLDNNMLQIDGFEIWKARMVGDLAAIHVGCSGYMQMNSLCTMMQKLQYDPEMLFQINGFRITNPYLRYPDPALRIELMFTVTAYMKTEQPKTPEPASGAAVVAASETPAVEGMDQLPPAMRERLLQMQKAKASGNAPSLGGGETKEGAE